MPDRKIALAVIFGCAGERLTSEERKFFRAADPLGFILFKRNCGDRAQVRRLVADLRETVGRTDAPVLIDQEGGRVQRLGPPHWSAYPAPALLAAAGEEATTLAARLIADDLGELGISVDCFPLIDLAVPGADKIIGDRTWGGDPDTVARFGRAACEGLLQGHILPVIKHIPGHGRATVDSHNALPRVATSHAELTRTDFAPFHALREMPWAMTAHVVYEAIDPDLPATLSPRVIANVIRGEIGFDGVLVSDDVSMGALAGTLAGRTEAALDAGCDIVLHCNGKMDEMRELADAARRLTDNTLRRLATTATRSPATAPFDRAAAEARFSQLMAAA